MIDNTLYSIKKVIPAPIFNFFNPAYHWTLSLTGALIYRFPSKKIKVIAVTGTKGKSSTVEIINAILEQAGKKTALSNTIRHKIADHSQKNIFKMSTPGRFFLQSFLRKAVSAGCEYAVLEISSQGAMYYRHNFIDLDTFIFTNLTPEHIEAHGTYENYRNAKLAIAKNIERSSKKEKTIIVNGDDKEAFQFLVPKADKKITYSLNQVEPYHLSKNGIDFTLDGSKVHSNLQGLFNLYNILAGITCAKNENIFNEIITKAIEELSSIPGRLEKIEAKGFSVIVDYAHTTDSLQKIYEVYKDSPIIGILGGTGGGRDNWKRKAMGKIADDYCKEIILTNEDPYDEDPMKIIDDVAEGITKHKPHKILDRREAIRTALSKAKHGDVIIISGKGTDPYIMGPNNTKMPWSDSVVVKEELVKLGVK
jgi:UDP-N-acetylmuramoyl-L-alanyl-D-glutamate--2,6-diaminopimelate ligase